METWLSIDNTEPTFERMTNEEIVQSASRDQVSDVQTKPAEDDDEIVYEPPPTATEAIKGLEVALRWLESSECATAAKVAHLRNLLHDAKSDAQKRKMTDFFTKKYS